MFVRLLNFDFGRRRKKMGKIRKPILDSFVSSSSVCIQFDDFLLGFCVEEKSFCGSEARETFFAFGSDLVDLV